MLLTPKSELRARVDRLQKAMKRKGLDGAIISQNVDLFYFSGTTQRSILYVPQQGPPVLMVQKSIERAKKESAIKLVEPMVVTQDIPKILKKHKIESPRAVGLEFDVLPVDQFRRLQKVLANVTFLDVSFLIRRLRMVKTPFEIEQIEKAIRVIEKILHKAQEIIREGMTEIEVDGLFIGLARGQGDQGRLRMRGWNQEMFHCHVLCGKTAAIPSFTETPIGGLGTTPAIAQGAGHNRIKRNEPILVDLGVGINGYVADITRTFVIGQLSERFHKGYQVLREVEALVESQAGPGVSCSHLYQEAVRLTKSRGFDLYFMGFGEGKVNFLGHGLGLEIDELPVLAKRYHPSLEQGMVFALEPKMVFPGEGAIGLEDDYLVTSRGIEKLSHFDDDIIHL
ncbi:MAG: M24 family metallopeptidase [Proteobacteria bacterium]|nr:M24 family metallopeptidase [Pseudomonadota bacterium]NIS71136.1 M24 family metallopeptidase [Pseudomonadota bacterium]